MSFNTFKRYKRGKASAYEPKKPLLRQKVSLPKTSDFKSSLCARYNQKFQLPFSHAKTINMNLVLFLSFLYQ